jgi:hypothetical protein
VEPPTTHANSKSRWLDVVFYSMVLISIIGLAYSFISR